ncbi:putative transcriptional regulatory protein C3C7.04 [Candida viswanathii]|uniref:Putative transcriptional regulatory protein C3C7.04 n=1 Tax=Candida viswanathii TaxID=5486 RepID=A0A367XR71_9ASCO|nr:putative transcriptional regulatory protein C3C7.04 [Candida viswanathii]
MSSSNKNHAVDKPKPLKVYGRHHYACTRCKVSKIKCSGEKPSCSNCKNINKPESCKYPKKDRKIVIMESDLNKLHEKVQQLESQLTAQSSLLSLFTIRENLKFFFENEYENYEIQFSLVNRCLRYIPDKSYCLILIEKVYYSYNLEFYLVDKREIQPLIDNVHELASQISNPEYIPQITQISLCYFFILIAFGEQLLNVNTPNASKYPGLEYYQFAEHLFRLTRPNMSSTFIQCGLLLGLYSANLARYNTAYNFFGIATRSAVSQGYHRNKEIMDVANKSALEIHELKMTHEKMKRLWWTIFVIDTTWCTKTVHLQYTDTDVNLPCEDIHPLHDDDLQGGSGVDSFDLNTLELNVHLTKYVAKFIRLIYGPNIRTFSIKYINTSQFNQKQLLENIIASNTELIAHFEIPYLSQFQNVDYLNRSRRTIANLFLRYHQLIILITKPLLSVIINNNAPLFVRENVDGIKRTIAKGMFTSCATIDIVSRLYTNNKIFVLGYWDSQHLFTAIMMLIVWYVNSKGGAGDVSPLPQLARGIALLKYMAGMGNVNAKLRIEKIYQVNALLPHQIDLNGCNVECTIFDYVDYYSTTAAKESAGNDEAASISRTEISTSR